ncbi:universal stress protein [Halosegnis marinus]|uniref:Universal stress protein n=1 Tax=Halosegnis marinus TaxID=3034023 RepID=A0ABD5ZRF9_9EURY|nr:universal stress protein [Halosegnis sp. DT85]
MPVVLLAVDDAERAASQAAQLLDLFDGDRLTVWVLHVFGENAEGSSVSQVEAARRAEERLLDGGAEVTLRGESGDPADRIVAVADELDVDAVCVGGRDRSPTGKALFGSVAQSVMLRTERPVLFCRR